MFPIKVPEIDNVEQVGWLNLNEAISADNDYIPIWALTNSTVYKGRVNKIAYYRLQVLYYRIRKARGIKELIQIFQGSNIYKFSNPYSRNIWSYIEIKVGTAENYTINRYVATNGLIFSLRQDVITDSYIVEPLVVTCMKQRLLFKPRTPEERTNLNPDDFAIVVDAVKLVQHKKFYAGLKKYFIPEIAGQIDIVMSKSIINTCYNAIVEEPKYETLDQLQEHLKTLNQTVIATL